MKISLAAFFALALGGLILAAAMAQTTPGAVSVTTTSTVTATAGSITCTVASTTPQPSAGIHIACKAANGDSMTQDAVIAASGVTGAFNVAGDAVTWIVSQGTAALQWQVAANGVAKSGTF